MAGWSKAMRRRPRGAGACGAVDPQRDGFGYAIAVIVTSFLPKLGMERLGPRPNEGQDPLIARSRFEAILFRVRRQGVRSEEHTSELQSLMRISYAVFCLKKKKKKEINHT